MTVATVALLVACSAFARASTSPYLTLKWTRAGTGPVLQPGSFGTWDSGYVVAGPALQVSGIYHLWYTGSTDGSAWSIGHATSTDGIHWTKGSQNPVLPGVQSPAVLYDAGEFKMWVRNVTGNSISYYTSPDGTAWTPGPGNPALLPGPGWDSDHAIPGAVMHNATGYYLYYEGISGTTHQGGLATSSDGIHWTKSPFNPVLPAYGPWYSSFVVPCSILDVGSERVLWFVGGYTTNFWSLGVAVSTTGTQWQVANGTALSPNPGHWDGVSLSRAAVLQSGGILRMWYTGGNGSDFQVGFANATLPTGSSGAGGTPSSGGLDIQPLLPLLVVLLIGAVAIAAVAAVVFLSRRR